MTRVYTDAKRVEVVTTYLALGKVPLVSAVTGIPSQTIHNWKMLPWWKELEGEIRRDENTQLDSKLSKIIDRSLDCVVDRIERGDFLLDSRTGDVRRVPVKLRDVHKVSVDLLDKRELIRGKKEATGDKSTVDDVIKKLAEQFKQFVTYQKATTIEGEIVDAIHDEREEGLLTGVAVGAPAQTQSCEAESGTEQSESGVREGGEGTQG